MNDIKDWAVAEIGKLTAEMGLEREEIKQLVTQLMSEDAAGINGTISSFMDYSRKDVKVFINEFIDRIQNQRRYEEKAREVQISTSKQAKAARGNNLKAKRAAARDLSKIKLSSRKVCYCQCTQHPLVNNCINCGKIVCEMEGEGPCLFCGAWVDRETTYDIREVIGETENDEEEESFSLAMASEYEKALKHRDKLLDFDKNAAKRLGVIDARQDWFEESNNTWLNKDQRNLAKQMVELEKKRAEVIDEKMNVTFDLEAGTATIKTNETDNEFSFAAQNKQVNQFLQDQLSSQSRQDGMFRPFEADGTEGEVDIEQVARRMIDLQSFSIKAANLSDSKSQNLYKQLNPGYEKPGEETKKGQKGKKGKQTAKANTKFDLEDHKREATEESRQRSQIFTQIDQSLSLRLQDENPFDEFRQAVENAIIEKSKQARKTFQYDKAFFKEAEDTGMCISMHQPWASLMVHGFKRFEGREWSTKYRGPLWVQATSKKALPEEISALEQAYESHYASVGEDRPPFPQRYPNSAVIGRVDLVDVITLDQYTDTIPEVLRERTTASYQFVLRNPMYLDMPLRMPGQPSIFKMPKEISLGARPLLKRVPYSWWPPKQFANLVVGQFDIYPERRDLSKLQRILSSQTNVSAAQASQPSVDSLEEGCYIARDALNLHLQQQILNSVREACLDQPHKFKFERVITPTREDLERESTLREESKTKFVPKTNCYSLSIPFEQLPNQVKGVPLEVEGVVRDHTQHWKSTYRTVRFDFFKEQGFGDEIEPITTGGDHKKKQRKLLTHLLVCIGNQCDVEYTIKENNIDYTRRAALNSGDVFFADQKAANFGFRVSQVREGSKPGDLCLREGTLIVKFDKN